MQIDHQLLDAGETKDEGVKHSAEDRLGRDVGILARVGELIDVATEVKDFVEVGGEGRQRVGACFHSSNCNKGGAAKGLPSSLSFTSCSWTSSAPGGAVPG